MHVVKSINACKATIKFYLFVILVLPQVGFAAIPVGNDERLTFYGDILFRYDSDTRDHSTKKERNQLSILPHFGANIKLDPNWTVGMRMGHTTNSLSARPQPQSFGTGSNVNNGEDARYGLDKGYIQYFRKNLRFWAGKNSINMWQQNDVFWDQDINPEGVATSYESMPLTVNFGYFILNENGWKPEINKNDDTMFVLQGIYKGYIGNLLVSVGIASVLLDDTLSNGKPGVDGTDVLIPAPGSTVNAQGVATVDKEAPGHDFGTLAADQNYILSLEFGITSWSAGIDLLTSNADSEKLGYVLQGKYRFEDVPLGFHAGYYYIEAFSVIANGLYTQDDFPTPGQSGVSNFKGFNVQVDYYLSEHVTLDLRFYKANKIKNLTPPSGYVTDPIMFSNSHNRLQLNLKANF